MIVQIFPEQPGEPYARCTVNGHTQDASAILFNLVAGKVTMTVWPGDTPPVMAEIAASKPGGVEQPIPEATNVVS